MHTANSSSRRGASTRHPPNETPQEQTPWTRHPLDQAPPWTRHPPGPGTPLDQAPLEQTTQTRHTSLDQAPSWDQAHPLDKAPPCGQTHACKHIILPQNSFAGGYKY